MARQCKNYDIILRSSQDCIRLHDDYLSKVRLNSTPRFSTSIGAVKGPPVSLGSSSHHRLRHATRKRRKHIATHD